MQAEQETRQFLQQLADHERWQFETRDARMEAER